MGGRSRPSLPLSPLRFALTARIDGLFSSLKARGEPTPGHTAGQGETISARCPSHHPSQWCPWWQSGPLNWETQVPPSSLYLAPLGIKRLSRELAEIQGDPSPLYYATPRPDDFFHWHFVIAGPDETEFSSGLYHGRILLPPEYPFRPPWIIFTTPNGRFELHKKICLSVTAHHPEEWNPSWGIRTVLLAISSHLVSEDRGSIGYLGYSREERTELAQRSRTFVCPDCEVSNEQFLARSSAQAAETKTVEARRTFSLALGVVGISLLVVSYFLLRAE